jgi:general secretion pathway protein A
VYAAYFGLTERPFSLAPDPRYLFLSEGHREALAHLVYGLQGGGFVQLTGEIGTGKTTVCRALLDQLPPEVDVAMIFTPRLTAVELLAAVSQELHVDIPAGTTSVKVLIDALSKKLLETHAQGRRTVVIIDEAQNLSPEVLEELRLLTNIETTREKLLQVILIGQPELADLLKRADLRQLGQRITARYHLRPFRFAETKAYVRHRLEVAGQHEMMFSRAALWLVHRRSGGVARLINSICDRALLGGFAKGKRRLSARIVHRAAAEVLGPGAAQYCLEAGIAAAIIAATLFGVTMLRPNAIEYVTQWWAKRILVPGVAAPRTAESIATPAAAAAAAAPAMPAGAPVVPTASVVAPTADGEKPTLVSLLGSRTQDRDAAFSALLALWGQDYSGPRAESGCDHARRVGLRCLARSGTWNVLRRLDLPVVLTLRTPAGDAHYGTVTGLTGESAILDLAGTTATFSLGEIEQLWDGDFVAVWKTQGPAITDLRPGMSSRDVVWLRRQLTGDGGGDRTLYDDELKQRVVAFQRENGLTPDGIVGEETLVRISAMAPDARMPSLSKARP